jgi:uncharacterized protein (TIGR02145 family)
MTHFKTFSFAALLLVVAVSCGKPEDQPGQPENRPENRPTSVVLSHSFTTRMKGAEFKLKAALLPDGAKGDITWTSSVPAVATVDATTGVIKALTSGVSKITATVGTLTAECTLTVEMSCTTDSSLGTDGIGTASFVSDKTWTAAGLVWSDEVTATGCQKTTYVGELSNGVPVPGSFRSDCRSNPGYGDLFSWCAAIRYQDILCPEGWRLPTVSEFIALDIEMGFSGSFTEPDWSKVESTYLNADKWGAKLSGSCMDRESFGAPSGTLVSQGNSVGFWASSEHVGGNGYLFYLSKGYPNENPAYTIPPALQPDSFKNMYDDGHSLRCVKTI